MSKLKVEKGQIVKESVFEAYPLTVSFKRLALAPNGDLGRVTMNVDGAVIELTFPQALSLAGEIMRRCQ